MHAPRGCLRQFAFLFILGVPLAAQAADTDIPSPLDPPGPVKAWSAEKIARAVATVTLH